MLTAVLATLLAVAPAGAQFGQHPSAKSGKPTRAADKITVYRTATCGCCGKWVDHLRAAGFDVDVHVVDKVDEAPRRTRVPEKLRSCHTGTAGRYAIEGHIPADVIKDLLRRRPAIDGIAVPGMPLGSPGMESPNPQRYEVIAFDRQGRTSVFARR